MLRTVFLYFVLISAGLAPAGSLLVSYNECDKLARPRLGLSRWKQRLVSYFADIPQAIVEIQNQFEFPTLAASATWATLPASD